MNGHATKIIVRGRFKCILDMPDVGDVVGETEVSAPLIKTQVEVLIHELQTDPVDSLSILTIVF